MFSETKESLLSQEASVKIQDRQASKKQVTVEVLRSKPITISQYQHMGSIILGVVPGFGLGHALQGRYFERAWIFTVLEGGLATGLLLSLNAYLNLKAKKLKKDKKLAKELLLTWSAYSSSSKRSHSKQGEDCKKGKSLDSSTACDVFGQDIDATMTAILLFALAYAGVKVWEIADVWRLPAHYKVVKKTPFEIKPVVSYDPISQFHYGLSLNYQI